MTETPFFSIIIPTYNRESFILKTLDSVFSQTLSDYEIIVVDNLSTDSTKEVLTPLIEKNKIRFIQHDKNYERAKSRNTGMNNAKGEFVTFLDSDDLMYENCLKDAFDYIKNHSNLNLIYNQYEFIDEKGNSFSPYEWKKSNNHLKNISTGNFLACIGVFVSKKIYTKHRFDEEKSLTGSEDWDFWLRVLAEEEKIGTIETINSGIVEHAGRTMNQINIDQLIARRIYILNKVENSSELKKIYAPYLNFMKASSYLFIASNAAAIGYKKEAKEYLIKSIKFHKGFIFSPRTLITLKNIILK